MIRAPVPNLTEVALSICNTRRLDFIAEVGGGGFKKVFHVKASDGNSYALKVLLNPDSPRTHRERDAMLRCDHPNIARLLHFDTHIFNGRPYDFLLEEYLPGGNLTDRYNNHGPLTITEAIELGSCLINALSQLSDLGLVHRDIKPDNIMYRDDNQTPVLSDFGIVRDLSAESLTKTAAMQGPGTPLFSSPEQLNNQKDLIDWRSDQFSLGVTLCMVVFKTHPYQLPNEAWDDPAVVERVALRGKRSVEIINLVSRGGLPSLVKMTQPWPIGRYIKPNDLALAWEEQKGIVR